MNRRKKVKESEEKWTKERKTCDMKHEKNYRKHGMKSVL